MNEEPSVDEEDIGEEKSIPLQLKIGNKDFSNDLNDPSSAEYQELSKELTLAVNNYLPTIKTVFH